LSRIKEKKVKVDCNYGTVEYNLATGEITCIPEIEPLEKVFGSSYCEYSVIENKLATLYKNQEKIYRLLQNILEKVDK